MGVRQSVEPSTANEPEAVHFSRLTARSVRGSSVPAYFGGSGTGVSRRKGLPEHQAYCPTWQGPSVTAITICSISSSRDVSATFTPQDFPSPALLVPYSGTHNSHGAGSVGKT